MLFLKTYWKQIAIIAFIAIIFLFGCYEGYSYEKRAYDTFKAETETNAKVEQAKNADLLKNQQNISENLTKEYLQNVESLKSYYSTHRDIKWLPVSPPSNSMPKVSDTASSTDGETKSIVSDTEPNQSLDCASDVEQLLELQKWIEQNLELN
jgi:hypothetical protein